MSDYTNTNIGSGYNTSTALNTELGKAAVAVNSKLDKTGGTLSGDLDMDSNDILNADTIYADSIILDGGIITPTGTFDLVIPTNSILTGKTTATAGQTVFTIPSYTVGANTVFIYINGQYQYLTDSYVETNSTTITFNTGLNLGDDFYYVVNQVAATTAVVGGANLIEYTPNIAGGTKRFLQAKLEESIDVKDFGAIGDGTTDDTAALQAADTAAAANGSYLTGAGTFLISSQVILASRFISMLNGTIKLGDSFPSTEGIILASGNNEIIDISLSVDGNKANQGGASTGVVIRDISTGTSNISINALSCKTGVLVDGNTERLNVRVGGYLCDLLVHQKININTPDEMNYWISGGLCDMWFKQEDNTTARVIFNVENNTGASDFAVRIEGAKYTSLGGIIRGVAAGGVFIDVGTDHMVNFDNLCIYGVSGDYGVYAYEGRTLTGSVDLRAVAAGGVFIGYFGGGVSLDIAIDSLTGGRGLRLGEDGIKSFRFGNIKYIGYGNAGSDFGVEVDSVSGHLELDMTASDHTLRTNAINSTVHIEMSARIIQGNVEVSVLNQTPAIDFMGTKTTIAQLAAYSYSVVGMNLVHGLLDTAGYSSQYRPTHYVGGNWTEGTINYASSGALAQSGILTLDSTGGALTMTLAGGADLYQRAFITKTNAGNTSTVSVTSHETTQPEVFTFASQYSVLVLEWMGARWRTVYMNGPTV